MTNEEEKITYLFERSSNFAYAIGFQTVFRFEMTRMMIVRRVSNRRLVG